MVQCDDAKISLRDAEKKLKEGHRKEALEKAAGGYDIGILGDANEVQRIG